jgi:hypothetical protein
MQTARHHSDDAPIGAHHDETARGSPPEAPLWASIMMAVRCRRAPPIKTSFRR